VPWHRHLWHRSEQSRCLGTHPAAKRTECLPVKLHQGHNAGQTAYANLKKLAQAAGVKLQKHNPA